MRIARPIAIVLAAALIALTGALALALVRRPAIQVPALAVERLRDAAAQRPVDQTDQIIWDYQERVRQSPDDVGAYATLGEAYVQNARETGDPAYYGKAEAVFGAAIERDPQNVEA